MRPLVPALMLLLAACASEPAPDGNQSAAAADEGGAAPQDDAPLAGLTDDRAMTSIDAASGDAQGMPGEYSGGPTAGEIAARAAERDRAAHIAMERALDAAENLDVSLPDPLANGEAGAGESSVVETQ